MTLPRWFQRRLKGCAGLALILAAAACASPHYERHQPGPHVKVGQPYKINGRWYHPKVEPDYDRSGVASWYGRAFHGKRTANGEVFDMNLLSAAHTTLPMPSMVEVRNLENGRSVVVRVNDRGPFADNRLIDLSREAARRLGFEQQGLAQVRVRYIGPAPLHAKAPSRPNEALRYAARAREARRGESAPVQQRRNTAIVAAAAHVAPTAPAGNTPPATQSIATFEPVPSSQAMAPTLASVRREAPAMQTRIETTAQAVEKLYVIRVAALSRLDNVERLRTEMAPIGPLRVSRIEMDNARVFYRVSMGPFNAYDAAAARLEEVRAAGYADASIVAITP